MVTEDEVHDLFARALPDLRDEPELPDFRLVARHEGSRLRRRRRVLSGVGVVAAGAVVAGAITAGAWLPNGSGAVSSAQPGAGVPGSASPEPRVPESWTEFPGAGESNALLRETGPEQRLLEALRAHMPGTVRSIGFDPDTDDASYVVTFDGGRTLRLSGTGLPVSGYWGLPGAECGHPDTAPGGPTGPQADCDRRTLPDGSRAVAEQYSPPEPVSASWLSIKTRAGNQRFLVSTSRSDTGPPTVPPLTVEELYALASVPEVIEALDALKYNQRW